MNGLVLNRVWSAYWSLPVFPRHGRGYLRSRGLFQYPESLEILWSSLSCLQPSLEIEPPGEVWVFCCTSRRVGWESKWGFVQRGKSRACLGLSWGKREGASRVMKSILQWQDSANFNWLVSARHYYKCLSRRIPWILAHISCSRCLGSHFTNWRPKVSKLPVQHHTANKEPLAFWLQSPWT